MGKCSLPGAILKYRSTTIENNTNSSHGIISRSISPVLRMIYISVAVIVTKKTATPITNDALPIPIIVANTLTAIATNMQMNIDLSCIKTLLRGNYLYMIEVH